MTPEQLFLEDFDLHSLQTINRIKKRKPFTYCLKSDDNEGPDHWNLKSSVYLSIQDKYKDNPKFFITTELKQVYNPFISELDKSTEYYKFFKLDICVVYFDKPRKPMVLDVEIDGENHYKKKQMDKDKIRDGLLKMRYNVDTIRVDVSDPNLTHITTYLHNRIG